MFRSRKKSNTVLSFWSPQIRISAMDLKVSTNKLLFDSVTVWFLYRTEYKYFKCSREWGFLGFQMPPKSPRFLNISFFRRVVTVFFCRFLYFSIFSCFYQFSSIYFERKKNNFWNIVTSKNEFFNSQI